MSGRGWDRSPRVFAFPPTLSPAEPLSANSTALPPCRAVNHPVLPPGAFGCHLSSGVRWIQISLLPSVGLLGRPHQSPPQLRGSRPGCRRSSVGGKEQVSPLHFVTLLILGSEGPTSSVLPAHVPFPPTLKPPDDTPAWWSVPSGLPTTPGSHCVPSPGH